MKRKHITNGVGGKVYHTYNEDFKIDIEVWFFFYNLD